MKRFLKITACVWAVLALLSTASTLMAESPAKYSIRVKGSVVMAGMMQPMAPEFEKKAPNVSVVVYGSSDAAGFKSLLMKDAEVAMAMRGPSLEEEREATERKMRLSGSLLGYATGAIITNWETDVGALTLDQLGQIFSGHYTNWSQVGGPDQPITVVAMEKDAGAKFLAEEVFKVPFSPKAMMVPNYRKMLFMVSSRKGAVGFARTEMALEAREKKQARIVALKKDASSPELMPPVKLTPEAVKEVEYPLFRPLWLYCDQESSSPHVKDFVDFCIAASKQAAERGN